MVCSNQPNWYLKHWKSGSSGVTGFLISFLDSNLVLVCGRLSLGLGKGTLICVCIRKWGGPRESHLWRSDGQLVLIWRCFRRTSFWTDSVWPCGPNAGVFTGLKPFSSWIFLQKKFSPGITPWWKPKCGKWGQLGNFPQRRALVWIKMLIETHSASIFCWPTLQDYIPFVSLFLSFFLSIPGWQLTGTPFQPWVWSLADSKRALHKMLRPLAFRKWGKPLGLKLGIRITPL